MAREPAGWTDAVRRDGLAVAFDENTQAWTILLVGAEPVVNCPCCGKLFATQLAAKLTCNALFPLPSV